jgi:dihydroorotase
MNIEIRNGRLIDPAHGVDAQQSVFISNGRVAGIGSAPAGFTAEQVLDAAGCLVVPGLIDLSARLPNIDAELGAAVAGGVTRLACPPDTDPPLDEPELVERLVRRVDAAGLARVHPLGALTLGLAGGKLAEMVGLTQAGCVAFTQANAPLPDSQSLLRVFDYAATFDYPVWLRPQEASLAKGGVAHDGVPASSRGLPGIPVVAETIAVAQLLELARATGVRLHLMRLSSAAGVDMVRAARAAGVAVTADVAVHHLHLSDEDLGYFDASARLDPPLRAPADRDALRAGLADGTLTAVCSDHKPVKADDKLLPFGEATPGATGLELLLPLTLRWAEESGLPLATAIARITTDPARLLGLDAGHLAVGAAADVCVVDPAATWVVGADSLQSNSASTPFAGDTLTGKVKWTVVAGKVVYSA